MRGQVAVEYLVIFAAFLAIFGGVIWPRVISPAQQTAIDVFHLSRARELADRLAEMMNSVCASGEGAVRSCWIELGTGCRVIFENSGEARVVVEAMGESFEVPVRFGVSGENYLAPGTYWICVRWPPRGEPAGISWGENLVVSVRPG